MKNQKTELDRTIICSKIRYLPLQKQQQNEILTFAELFLHRQTLKSKSEEEELHFFCFTMINNQSLLIKSEEIKSRTKYSM